MPEVLTLVLTAMFAKWNMGQFNKLINKLTGDQ